MISLHQHSTFSFLDGFGKPEQIVKKAKSLGNDMIALTDHGNIIGFPSFEKFALKEKVKPIFGCEFYIVEDVMDNQRSKNHITVLAKNQKGLENLRKLVNLSYTENCFYYRPTIDLNFLISFGKGLIILSGCQKSLIAQAIIKDNVQKAFLLSKRLHSRFGDDFFFEIQAFDLENTIKVNKKLLEFSKKLGIKAVATNDVHYLEKDEKELYKVLRCIRIKKKFGELNGWKDVNMHQCCDKEIVSVFKNTLGLKGIDFIDNTYWIGEQCSAKLEKSPDIKMEMPEEEKENYFKNLMKEGFFDRELHKKDNKEVYIERMWYEFKILKDKKFLDYILIVSDIVKWAKQQDILVGVGRGSSAGSLVCYLLEITEVDPIVHNLMFERFVDVTRADLPDIDIDFERAKREEVKNYIKKKFGEDKVASLSAYSSFKGRNIIDDITRIFSLPKNEMEKVKEKILIRSSGDARSEFTLQDTFTKFPETAKIKEKYPQLALTEKLEGQIRQRTIHASGVVISNISLSNLGAFDKNGNFMNEYFDAEYLNLLKIDILGLKTLDIIKRIMDKIGMKLKDLYSLPLNDKKVLKNFNDDTCVGIFQFDGNTARTLTKQIDIDDFKILTHLNALSRPGTLSSGTKSNYLEGKKGVYHPKLWAITKETRYQIVFQEQVMKAMRDIGKFNWEDTSSIRKAMSKSLGMEYVNKYREKFVKGAKEEGINDVVANKIFDYCYTFGAWGFNMNHSVSYAMISYWTMYFKLYYPIEFYWSNLVEEPEDEEILQDYIACGHKLRKLIFGKSKANWAIEDKLLRPGFLCVKGIGEKAALKLEDESYKPKGKIKELLGENGCFEKDGFTDNLMGMGALLKDLNKIIKRTKTKDIGRLGGGIFVMAGLIVKRDLRIMTEQGEAKTAIFYNSIENESWEKLRKSSDEWVNFILKDETGTIQMSIPRFRYKDQKIKKEIWEFDNEKDIYIIKGRKRPEERRLWVIDLWNTTRRKLFEKYTEIEV